MEQAPTGPRVAFFGGSFDPPHLGHLAVARAARGALDLDTVLFAPVGAQPLKPLGSAASFEDRLAMTQLAIAGEPGFAVTLADAPQRSGAPNYTLETLLGLRAALPAGGALFCLMGADSFFGLRRWRGAEEIPFVAPLIVASRPGQQLEDVKTALPPELSIESAPGSALSGSNPEIRSYRLRNSSGAVAPFYLLPGLNVDVSASEIREVVRSTSGSGTAVHEVLPVAVSDYIRSRGLYR
jgi:nicotinate-nucleotide adenylyltransferase